MATWSNEAKSALKPIDKAYASSMRSVAFGLAVGERSERVLVKHVEEAYRVLAASAHDMKPWYKRTQTESAIGGAILGFSFAIPDVIAGFCPTESTTRSAITQAVMGGLMLGGTIMTVHAILRGRGVFS